MESLLLALTDKQLKKLAKGQVSQLNKDTVSGKTIGGGAMECSLHLKPRKKKALDKARRAGKGYRLQMDQEELKASGLLTWLKKAGKATKKLIDSDWYQEKIKPALREGSDMLIDQAPAPELAKDILRTGRNWVGDKTGAFGVIGGSCCPTCTGSGMVRPCDPLNTANQFAAPNAYHPSYYRGFGAYASNLDAYGGSFKPIGGSFSAI